MRNHKVSLPVLISFSELAWIMVFAFAFVIYVTKSSPVNEKKQYEEYYNALKEEKKQGEEKYNYLLQEYNNLLSNNKNNINLDEEVIRREIVGLKGKLEKVAVLFDTSSSMKEGNRWELARNVVATWLNYLPISECVLITFNSSVNIFPQNGSLLDMRGIQGKTNRKSILEILKPIKPSGGTDTLAALKQAYSYKNIDTIILFTDGEPSVGGTSAEELTDTEIPKILELCKKYPGVTINTVGLGNYFEAKLSKFLIELANNTGGAFLGR